jgi:hypothetical protein
MKHFVIFILILNAFQPVFSQGQDSTVINILFQGAVFDATTLKPVPNSQIFVNSSFSSASDSRGEFALYVGLRDTVEFKTLGYKSSSVIVNDSLAEKQYVAGIYLSTDTLSIAEVIIIPRIGNLKSEMLNSKSRIPAEMENARYNVAVSAYQGRTTTGSLGDAESNYQLLRQQQKTSASERGQIPSDRIAGLSPFMLIPAAYMLMRGLPQKAPAYKPDLSDFELEQIMKKYKQSIQPKKLQE